MTVPAALFPSVVIKLVDYGESDRIVTLLTRDHGKVTAFARGARRSQKRFGAALGLFAHVEALMRVRPQQDLWLLEEIQSAELFQNLPMEWTRFGQVSHACELVRELCPPHHPEPAVFQLFVDFLRMHNQVPVEQVPSLHDLVKFQLHLLQAVGLGMHLTDCASCGQQVDLSMDKRTHVGGSNHILDLQRGGLLCHTCLPFSPASQRHVCTTAAVTLMAALALAGQATPAMAFQPATVLESQTIIQRVFQQHIGKALHTADFFTKKHL